MIKLFAHRGFTDGKEIAQNSLASLKKAYETGFRAVEFDVWFFNQRLVLKHDEPEDGENLPQFFSYFVYGNQMSYWVDFKNLNETNCAEFLSLMRRDIEMASIDLEKIYFAPFITNYAIAAKILKEIRKIFGNEANVVAVCENLEDDLALDNLAQFLQQNAIKFLSIHHHLLNERSVKILSEVQIFAWTVNDQDRVRELEKLGVVAVATDVLVMPGNF